LTAKRTKIKQIKCTLGKGSNLSGAVSARKILAPYWVPIETQFALGNARALLVLESPFPQSLVPLRNILGVEVVESVSPSNG